MYIFNRYLLLDFIKVNFNINIFLYAYAPQLNYYR